MTTGSPLETIPAELLLRICEYLDTPDHRHVQAFALASRTCHGVASSCILRTMHIKVGEFEQIQSDLDRCLDVLGRSSSLKHVRRLIITAYDPPESAQYELYARRDELVSPDDDFAEPPMRALSWMPMHHPDNVWMAVAAFLCKLPALTDILYSLVEEFPTCLLQAIQQWQPNCRLHVDMFQSRSLDGPNKLPSELALLTSSPQLYSITSRSTGYALNGYQDFTYDATLQVLGGSAPNLRRVSLITDREGATARMMCALEDGGKCRQPWGGLAFENQESIPRAAHLTTFEMGGDSSVTARDLKAWTKSCDVSVLRTLKLRFPVDGSAMEWLAQNCAFPSLRTLVLGPRNETTEDYLMTTSFMLSLPPLRALRLSGEIGVGCLTVTLHRHGQSLRRLWLSFVPRNHKDALVLDADAVGQIRHCCPMLEDLSLAIPRPKGDLREVLIYRTLGMITRLQYLSITLDCGDMSQPFEDEELVPSDPSFDDFDREIVKVMCAGPHPQAICRQGHVRDSLINYAVDKKFARGIFHVISDAKPAGAFPLERMELRPEGGCLTDHEVDLFDHLGQWWLVERNPRDDCRNELVMKELPRRVDTAWKPEARLEPDVEPIFRRVWPLALGSGGDWREDWHSWPLAK
ncbi:hypothetical protein LTR85_006736 [Meristemomyces frigidus]|nr:hypothetical protein LTR85_006736 [Meristemomyces frigidus]